MVDEVWGWHFIYDDKLRDDTRAGAPGEVETYRRKLEICVSGLHFSRHLFHAMLYAPRPSKWLRRVSSAIADVGMLGSDKLVTSRRKIHWHVAVADVFPFAARQFALDVAHIWPEMPNEIRRWLNAPECGNIEYVKRHVETDLAELHARKHQIDTLYEYTRRTRRVMAIRTVMSAVIANQDVSRSIWFAKEALSLASQIEANEICTNPNTPIYNSQLSMHDFSFSQGVRKRELERERRLVDWAAAARK